MGHTSHAPPIDISLFMLMIIHAADSFGRPVNLSGTIMKKWNGVIGE